jgi:hypothetical protein
MIPGRIGCGVYRRVFRPCIRVWRHCNKSPDGEARLDARLSDGIPLARRAAMFRMPSVTLIAGLAALGAGAQPMVWVSPSLQRIRPSDAKPAGASLNAAIYAARGEAESFQIVVQGPPGGLTHVGLTVSPLLGPAGAIPAQNLTLYREHYVYVSPGSTPWGGSNNPQGPGWYPDGLIPFVDPVTGLSLSGSGAALIAVPFSLSAGADQPLWVDVLVPRDAAPGSYVGSYTVTSDQGSVTGSISLTVWAFTLPTAPALKSAFLLWSQGGLHTDEELLRNRIQPSKVSTGDEASLIPLGLGTTDLGLFSGADNGTCSLSAAPSVSQLKALVGSHNAGLALYDYSADEIGGCGNLASLIPQVQQWGCNLHQAGVNNLVTMAPRTDLLSDGCSSRSAVDLWTMLPVTYDNAAANVLKAALQKGDQLWSYNTLVQDAYSPKWEIDFTPLDFRLQPGFISESLDLTGMLYWRTDLWLNADPWNQVDNAGHFSSADYPGEAMLIYPGTTVGSSAVAPSMRLKWLRDGVDDYDYVELLKAAGQGNWALGVVQPLAPSWSGWTRDPVAVEAARLQLGQKLDALVGGTQQDAGTQPDAGLLMDAGTTPDGGRPTGDGGGASPDGGRVPPPDSGSGCDGARDAGAQGGGGGGCGAASDVSEPLRIPFALLLTLWVLGQARPRRLT